MPYQESVKVRRVSYIATLLFIAAITFFGSMVIVKSQNKAEDSIRVSLTSIATTTAKSLSMWLTDNNAIVSRLGSNQSLDRYLDALIDVSDDWRTLSKHPYQSRIKEVMNVHVREIDNESFHILDTSGRILSATHTSVLGEVSPVLVDNLDILPLVLEGNSLYLPPKINSLDGSVEDRNDFMIEVISPIVDRNLDVVGMISIKFNATRHFSQITQLGHLGKTGITYAFDHRGRLLTTRQTLSSLYSTNISNALFDALVADNTVNRDTQHSASIVNTSFQRDFFEERSSALIKYTNWVGKPVVGVVAKYPGLHFMVAAEMSSEEAFETHNAFVNTTLLLMALSIGLTILGYYLLAQYSTNKISHNHIARAALEKEVAQRTVDLQEKQIQLEDALAKAKSAAQAKSVFLANMSHEIRTPMNAILGFTEVLRQTDLSEKQSHHLETIHRSASSLLVILNDILDISKMEEGKLTLESIPFNLRDLIHEAFTTLKQKADEKGLYLRQDYQLGKNRGFIGDPTRLKQVLLNLIGNAIKFTEAGGITVSVLHTTEQRVSIHIIDTGIGIPEERLDSVLDPFTQADASTTRKYGGTGLGTTISRQIIENMGGKLAVSSEVGRGSDFYFTLKLKSCDNALCESCVHSDNYQVLEGLYPLKILYAEDVPENIELLSIWLSPIGHELIFANNGRIAADLYEANPKFDLILMDIQMPEMDGISAAEEIRAFENDQGLPEVPIIALTASVLPEELEACYAAGMNGFVAKPVNIEKLFKEISRLAPTAEDSVLNLQKNTADPQSLSLQNIVLWNDVKQPPDILAEMPCIEATQGMKIWGSSNEYLNNLCQFSQRQKDTVSRLHTALTEHNWHMLINVSHKLMGTTGNLAMTDIWELCQRINQDSKVLLKNASDTPDSTLCDDLTLLLQQLDVEMNRVFSAIDEIPDSEKYHQQHTDDTQTNAAFSTFSHGESNINIDDLQQLLQAVDDDDIDEIESTFMRFAHVLPQPQKHDFKLAIETFRFEQLRQLVNDIIERKQSA